ncbi:MAG: hypothetical protein SVU88_01620 [Candidatus Nanohaloarchaea archaeon]|nr:hypothetical protein [Candidatus Nanohaloarchaea archaeon]
MKIGPAEEEMYDRVIRPALGHDTVQTVQPLDDGRTTVPPYTLHGDTPRPCFGDDTADFATKIRDFDEEFLRVRTNGGKSWHPVVHTAMRLAEARRAMNLPGYTVRAGREDKPAPRYRRDPHPEMVEIVPRNYPGGQRSMELATAGDVEEYLFSDGVTLEDVRDITPALGRPVLDTLDPDDLDGGVPRHSRPAYPEHTSAYQEP